MKTPKPTSLELYSYWYQIYLNEAKQSKNEYPRKPLHLFSVRVYLAYNNLWKLINRPKLTPEEIHVMKQIGCYQPSRSELGIPRYRSKVTEVQTCDIKD